MSVYMTEEEQLEVIKKWWRKYGNWVTTACSVVLLCIAGYRYWFWHESKVTQQASVVYEHMMVAFSNQDVKAVRSYANELINQHAHSVYSDAAHLILAKLYVSKEKLDAAGQELRFVATESRMPALKQIAKIRLARVLAAQKSFTNALNELTTVDDKTYLAIINELKGDIYGETGQYQEAINAYRLAIKEVKTNGMGNLFLEMKTNELALKNQSSNDSKKTQET